MIVTAVDPGPDVCGVVVYDYDSMVVRAAHGKLSVESTLDLVGVMAPGDLLLIERVSSTGQSGASLLETSEVVGRLWQQGRIANARVELMRRREVVSVLSISGKGKDAQVSALMRELHGGGSAVGKKATPGPLYGVAHHAWQALGLAVAWGEREGLQLLSRRPHIST